MNNDNTLLNYKDEYLKQLDKSTTDKFNAGIHRGVVNESPIFEAYYLEFLRKAKKDKS